MRGEGGSKDATRRNRIVAMTRGRACPRTRSLAELRVDPGTVRTAVNDYYKEVGARLALEFSSAAEVAEARAEYDLLIAVSGPSLRFSSPLIEPDVTISVIRLSDGFHVTACAAAGARESAATGRPVPQRRAAWETADSQTRHLVPAAEKATDGVVEVKSSHRAAPSSPSRRRSSCTSPARCGSGADDVLPRRLVSRPQPLTNGVPDGRDGLLRWPHTVVASAGPRRVHRSEGVAEEIEGRRIGRRAAASCPRSARARCGSSNAGSSPAPRAAP